MLAAIVLAVLTLPAGGKYLYSFTTASGAAVADDVWIYATSSGIVAHEEARNASSILANTNQHFDDTVGLRWYSGANANGSPLTIGISRSIYGPSRANVSASGKTAVVPFDRSDCVLVLDSGLTSSLLLPSLVRSTRSGTCTFIAANGATALRAIVDLTPTRKRPETAAPNDLVMTVKIGGVTETLWYDPKTLIPDYLDFGNGTSATLEATTGEQ